MELDGQHVDLHHAQNHLVAGVLLPAGKGGVDLVSVDEVEHHPERSGFSLRETNFQDWAIPLTGSRFRDSKD